jgi:signal transduction histidine kinase
MTSVDAKHTQNEVLLRDVLHIIATSREPSLAIPPLLEMIHKSTGASGVGFLLFHEPRLLMTFGVSETDMPSDDVFSTRAEQYTEPFLRRPDLPPDITKGYADWIIAPLRIQQTVAGIVWLVFNHPYQMNDADDALLTALVDGLTIVSTSARALARHERLMRNQSEFTRIVSHDLRSPLTSMQGFASMLESQMMGEMNEKQAHFVEKILAGIAQMTSLVDNIQDAGRYDPETGFYEMERTHCDLIEIAHRIVSNHLVPAEKGELTLTVNAASDVPIINADSNMIERALTNLVDNAIKYTPNGGSIEVRVHRRGDDVVLSVRDNGLGISPEHQKHLFERHVRIPRKEHKKVKGTGLGLFIVRSVAQRHGGKAWVESVEGNGSEFCMSIPLNGPNLIGGDSAKA